MRPAISRRLTANAVHIKGATPGVSPFRPLRNQDNNPTPRVWNGAAAAAGAATRAGPTLADSDCAVELAPGPVTSAAGDPVAAGKTPAEGAPVKTDARSGRSRPDAAGIAWESGPCLPDEPGAATRSSLPRRDAAPAGALRRVCARDAAVGLPVERGVAVWVDEAPDPASVAPVVSAQAAAGITAAAPKPSANASAPTRPTYHDAPAAAGAAAPA